MWTSNFSQNPCSGPDEKLKDRDCYVKTLLVRNKCIRVDDNTSYTFVDLLLNRISPYKINKESVALIDVCKTHWVSVYSL